MTENIPRYALKIIVIRNGQKMNIDFEFTVPTSQSAPMPGDEIQIPKSIAEAHSLKSTALKVVSRRFILDALPVGITGIIYLVSEEIEPSYR